MPATRRWSMPLVLCAAVAAACGGVAPFPEPGSSTNAIIIFPPPVPVDGGSPGGIYDPICTDILPGSALPGAGLPITLTGSNMQNVSLLGAWTVQFTVGGAVVGSDPQATVSLNHAGTAYEVHAAAPASLSEGTYKVQVMTTTEVCGQSCLRTQCTSPLGIGRARIINASMGSAQLVSATAGGVSPLSGGTLAPGASTDIRVGVGLTLAFSSDVHIDGASTSPIFHRRGSVPVSSATALATGIIDVTLGQLLTNDASTRSYYHTDTLPNGTSRTLQLQFMSSGGWSRFDGSGAMLDSGTSAVASWPPLSSSIGFTLFPAAGGSYSATSNDPFTTMLVSDRSGSLFSYAAP
jgi:hypothetical protein